MSLAWEADVRGYSLKCDIVELQRSVYDDSTPTCPTCGDLDIVRQYSAVGVTFKGKGFYRNDSRKQK